MQSKNIPTQLRLESKDLTLEEVIALRPQINELHLYACRASHNLWAQIIETLSLNKSLRKLTLRNCRIGETDPDSDLDQPPTSAELALERLQQITSLALNDCRLGQHAIEIVGRLTNLTELELQIRDFGEKINCLNSLVNLKRLNLKFIYNSQGFTKKFALKLPNLSYLSLYPGKNYQVMEQLPNLTELALVSLEQQSKEYQQLRKFQKLVKINLSGQMQADILFYISSLTNLTSLNIDNWGDNQIKIDQIQKFTNLSQLSIASRMIGNIGQSIASVPKLAELNLINRQQDDFESFDKQCQEISKIKSLIKLTLTSYPISDIGVKFLSSMSQLQQLGINVDSEIKIGPIGAGYLTCLKNLKILHLRGSCVGEEGAKIISTMRNLRDLDLCSNNVGSKGTRAICYGLPNLETLTLYEDSVGNQEVLEIIKLSKLKDLCLSRCQIDAFGMFLLERMKNLESISIDENQQMPRHLIKRLRKRLPNTYIVADDDME